MQTSFGFAMPDVARWAVLLAPGLAGVPPLPVRRPVGQLVKSIISGRTQDAVSLAAYDRLVATFGGPGRLAVAEPAAVARVIADVTFADDKAAYVVAALRMLKAGPLGFDLDPLGGWPLDEALAFLETLPGVGRKVAASTLNASTLAMPVMIVDGHVLRVLQRLGAVGPRGDIREASETVTGAMPDWTGADFLHFHMATKRLGQTICRPEAPLCDACPLAGVCPGAVIANRTSH